VRCPQQAAVSRSEGEVGTGVGRTWCPATLSSSAPLSERVREGEVQAHRARIGKIKPLFTQAHLPASPRLSPMSPLEVPLSRKVCIPASAGRTAHGASAPLVGRDRHPPWRRWAPPCHHASLCAGMMMLNFISIFYSHKLFHKNRQTHA
jgi:hypothetical protein